MDIQALITRRTAQYERAVKKTERIESECRAYERKNDGFLSSELLDKSDKARTAQSKCFALMTLAEKAA